MPPRHFSAALSLLILAASAPALAEVGALPATDRELRISVADAISRDRALDRLHLKVTAEDGTVTLAGQVPDLKLHREAIRLAANRRGVLEIRDDTIRWQFHFCRRFCNRHRL